MRAILLLALISSSTACGSDDHGVEGDLTRLDDASDEIYVTMKDLVDRGEVETNDDVAAQLIMPSDGSTLAPGANAQFAWSEANSSLRHGRTTGDFVWLEIDCGLDQPIDLLAIETTEWEMDDDHWNAVVEGGGPCEVQIVSAYVDRGIVTEGPYRPSATTSFTIE